MINEVTEVMLILLDSFISNYDLNHFTTSLQVYYTWLEDEGKTVHFLLQHLVDSTDKLWKSFPQLDSLQFKLVLSRPRRVVRICVEQQLEAFDEENHFWDQHALSNPERSNFSEFFLQIFLIIEWGGKSSLFHCLMILCRVCMKKIWSFQPRTRMKQKQKQRIQN
jgi:hypothetical protein